MHKRLNIISFDFHKITENNTAVKEITSARICKRMTCVFTRALVIKGISRKMKEFHKVYEVKVN